MTPSGCASPWLHADQAQQGLRIALLTYSTAPRGSVIHTLELAAALHSLGHQVCIYALDKNGQGFERQLSCEVKLVPAMAAPPQIDDLIRQRIGEFVDYWLHENAHPVESYDIYHAQDCISANALAQLRSQGVIASQLVRTVHHIEAFRSPYLQDCQERSIREPDLCLCVSDRWQQTLSAEYGIQAARVTNGINLCRFSAQPDGSEAELKQAIGLVSAPIYLTVGGIEPRKNSITLLNAFAQVLKTYPTAQLAIAGGATLFDYAPYRSEFFTVAQQLGIEPGRSLILPGVIAEADLPALYRTANAFVFPSTQEGWGLVLLEAIASGLPVITSRQPPFTEFLNPDQALLVNPESPEAIAQAMIDSIHPALAQSLIQKSQPILKRYTWNASAELHIHHYLSRFGNSPEWRSP